MSEETKHTPGPWDIESDPCHFDTHSTVVGGRHFSYRPGKDSFVLPRELIVQVGGQSSVEEQEANACLIAAAPDMLAALKAVASAADHGDSGHLDWALKLANAAIAKAEGRAE